MASIIRPCSNRFSEQNSSEIPAGCRDYLVNNDASGPQLFLANRDPPHRTSWAM
jgi:hypothetical protein